MGWGGGMGGGMSGGMGGMGGGGGGGGFNAMRRSMLAESDEDLGKVFDWRLMKRLVGYAGPYKKRAGFGVAAMLLLQATNILQPLIPGHAIDDIRHGDTHGLTVMVILFVISCFFNWMATYQQSYQMTRVGQYALYDLASDMFKHISHLSLSFFDHNETGRIMARVQNDVTVLQNLLSSGLISTIGNTFSITGILVVMYVVNWRLALFTSTSIPVFVIALLLWQSFSRRSFRKARATISVVNASLQENVSGVRVIQSMGREAVNSRQFDQANVANLEANLGAGRVSAAAQPIVELTSAMSLVLVLFFGGSFVIDHSMTIGQLVTFTLYIDRFFDPIRMITQQYNQLQRSTVAAERIFEILDTKADVTDAPDAYDLPQVAGKVEYEHVKFHYNEGVPIFEDLNMSFKAGERVALVGQTGAGKSTIVSLLMRFYDVTGGCILIDGHDIRSVTIRSLREQMGIVLQDPVLFSGTIAHNIRYAVPDATDAEVEKAAHGVGLHETIMRMANGYDTLVNERGIGLSIGQRQLISFARVLIANPRILILDEATASLDTSTELVVQEAIREVTRGRTAVMIAHRLSTIRDADRIIALENGRIVEQGTHDELIALRGMYYRLYSLGFQDTTAAAAPGNGNSGMARPGGRVRPSQAGA
jgi:ABC-type multidrug transport system fused ATPase/permease subunit